MQQSLEENVLPDRYRAMPEAASAALPSELRVRLFLQQARQKAGIRMRLVVAGLMVLPLAFTTYNTRAAAMPAPVAAGPDAAALAFRIDDGPIINELFRSGDVAAHLVLRSGMNPRLLVAFPAGNSGVGVWFKKSPRTGTWAVHESPVALQQNDSAGRPLRGIRAEVSIDASTLELDRAVLSSIRVLRDFEIDRRLPQAVSVAPTTGGGSISWERNRVDGKAGYRLSLHALGDTIIESGRIHAGSSGRIRLQLDALTGEQPLSPLPPALIFKPLSSADTRLPDTDAKLANTRARLRDVLSFLSYREKLLAGSWRFDTYFGRDTLMSLALLADVIQPTEIESGLISVLTRLSPNGEVAHEESIGEFPLLSADGRTTPPAVYDYSMIDEDFMLAPVVARCFAQPEMHSRARAFLASRDDLGRRYGDLLVRNFVWAAGRAQEFAKAPTVEHLIGLKRGHTTGQWRDSPDGLGGGAFPYDVNAVFVPAALSAIDALLAGGLLDPYLTPATRATLTQARVEARTWATAAPPLFIVHRSLTPANSSIQRYAAALGVPRPALVSMPSQDLQFDAVALSAGGQPIPVMHSDGGFALLFGSPSSTEVERIARTADRDFPAGLMTPIGLLVANAALADPALQAKFTNVAYHGTVVWSWQQAVLAAGLDRQLLRGDLPKSVHALLLDLQSRLWRAIESTRQLRSSELWSWSIVDAGYQPRQFGTESGSTDESNAAQLWSTVFLALHDPDSSGSRGRGAAAGAN